MFIHKYRVLGIIPNEVFLSDLSDKKYPRPDEIQDGFLIDNIICKLIVSWLWIAFLFYIDPFEIYGKTLKTIAQNLHLAYIQQHLHRHLK